MKMSDAFPSKYLKAEDLEDGDLVVTIGDVRFEEFSDPKTKRVDNKPVIYFEGNETKSMVLNKTNWKTITQVLGSDDTDDWLGKKIALYATEVESFGEMVLGIRVRLRTAAKPKAAPAQPQPARPQAVPARAAKPLPQTMPVDPYDEAHFDEAHGDGPPF